MELLSKLTAPMRSVGAMIIAPIGKIIDKTGAPDSSNMFPSESIAGTIANDAANEESSVGGAWANTLVLYLGWAAVLFSILGAVGVGVLKKTPMRRRRRKPTTRKTARRRTYRRRK